MTKKKVFLITMLIIIVSTVIFTGAQYSEKADAGIIDAKIVKFFEILKTSTPDDALANISKDGPLEEQLGTQTMINLGNQIKNAFALYQPAENYYKVRTTILAGTISKSDYIGVNPAYPLRWEFLFYKPKDKWILVNIKFDDDIHQLF